MSQFYAPIRQPIIKPESDKKCIAFGFKDSYVLSDFRINPQAALVSIGFYDLRLRHTIWAEYLRNKTWHNKLRSTCTYGWLLLVSRVPPEEMWQAPGRNARIQPCWISLSWYASVEVTHRQKSESWRYLIRHIIPYSSGWFPIMALSPLAIILSPSCGSTPYITQRLDILIWVKLVPSRNSSTSHWMK